MCKIAPCKNSFCGNIMPLNPLDQETSNSLNNDTPVWRLQCLAEESKRACGISVVSLQHSADGRVTGISGDGEGSIRMWKCQFCTSCGVQSVDKKRAEDKLKIYLQNDKTIQWQSSLIAIRM